MEKGSVTEMYTAGVRSCSRKGTAAGEGPTDLPTGPGAGLGWAQCVQLPMEFLPSQQKETHEWPHSPPDITQQLVPTMPRVMTAPGF